MITIKRSVDFYKDVLWIAHRTDWEARRCFNLYTGKDVNGAIDAAVKAGLSNDEAMAQATAEIARCKANETKDEIVVGAK